LDCDFLYHGSGASVVQVQIDGHPSFKLPGRADRLSVEVGREHPSALSEIVGRDRCDQVLHFGASRSQPAARGQPEALTELPNVAAILGQLA
jgi:hypothetical protein